MTGAPNSLLRQAGYFRSAGYAVDVWSLADGPLRARYEEAGFPPELVENDRRAIQSKYEENPVRYELVVCNTTKSYRAVDVLMRHGLKVVWFIRETKLVDEDFWLDSDFARLFSRFYNLYTVSEYAADVIRYYNPNVRVIHNALADTFEGFVPPASPVRFGFVGSLIEVKGIGLLLEAFRRMSREFPGVTLAVAGGASGGGPCAAADRKRGVSVRPLPRYGPRRREAAFLRCNRRPLRTVSGRTERADRH